MTFECERIVLGGLPLVLFNHIHTPGEEFNMIEDSQHGTNYYHALAPRLAAKVEKNSPIIDKA